MSDRDLSQIRTRIGMVFQHFALWPHLTVLQNLMEAPVQVQRRPKAEVRDEALALLAKVGLSEKRDAFPARLSGGQKQRVGIARALAMRPDLLLFDEPTSALDPELVGEVLVVMRDLAREGMTMVIVTHEMGFARDAATRVLFLDRGKTSKPDRPKTFSRNPKPNAPASSCSAMLGDMRERQRLTNRRARIPRPWIRSSICCPARRTGHALQPCGRGRRFPLRHGTTCHRPGRRFAADSAGDRSADAQGDG